MPEEHKPEIVKGWAEMRLNGALIDVWTAKEPVPVWVKRKYPCYIVPEAIHEAREKALGDSLTAISVLDRQQFYSGVLICSECPETGAGPMDHHAECVVGKALAQLKALGFGEEASDGS